jgi:hypothetical protein
LKAESARSGTPSAESPLAVSQHDGIPLDQEFQSLFRICSLMQKFVEAHNTSALIMNPF